MSSSTHIPVSEELRKAAHRRKSEPGITYDDVLRDWLPDDFWTDNAGAE